MTVERVRISSTRTALPAIVSNRRWQKPFRENICVVGTQWLTAFGISTFHNLEKVLRCSDVVDSEFRIHWLGNTLRLRQTELGNHGETIDDSFVPDFREHISRVFEVLPLDLQIDCFL